MAKPLRAAYYFAAYKEGEDAAQRLRAVLDAVPKGCEIYNVFRVRFPFLSDRIMAGANKHVLYDNFEKLGEHDVLRLERLMGKSYSLIRQMHTISVFRYPDMKRLPSDLYFAQLARAWEKFYIKNKIDFLAGGLYDDYAGFVGMEVARGMGIPIIVPYPGGRFTRAYAVTDERFIPIFYNRLPKSQVEKKYAEAVGAMKKETFTNKTIVQLADSYFNLLMLPTLVRLIKAAFVSFKTYYFELPPAERRIWLSPFELINRQTWYFLHSKFSRLVFNEKPVQGEKYVYFPLHFSLDAAIKSLNPLIDQVQLVKDIAKVLPHGTWLYVKPHPHWRCADIGIREMLALRRLPRVRLLDYNITSQELIRNSQYVIIINSSVGFEAIVQSKKVVSFGSGYPPEVIPKLSSAEELARIDKIKMNWKACREFVANSYSHAIYHEDQREFDLGGWTSAFSAKIFREMINAYKFVKGKKV